jgi:predicted membrane protein
VFSLIANRPINHDAVVNPSFIRLGFIVVALVITIISMFLKYETKRQAKCILLISAILMGIALTVGSSIAAISLYALIFCFLQLILPILYLIFKDDDPDAYLKSEKEREEAIEALIQLDQDLRDGYISDQEYDTIRKQYIDKL